VNPSIDMHRRAIRDIPARHRPTGVRMFRAMVRGAAARSADSAR
jgi:hypothetical protein